MSVAVGTGEQVLAHRGLSIGHSSEALLRTIDEVSAAGGVPLAEVDGLIGLRGPGSFTGLRVGLATLLGLHQALDLPATAIPTLEVLALAAPAAATRVVTVVDALRGEWFSQLLTDGVVAGEAAILSPEQIASLAPDVVVGHDLGRLADVLPSHIDTVEPAELAPLALQFALQRPIDWAPATLLEPLYLRPPAIHGRS